MKIPLKIIWLLYLLGCLWILLTSTNTLLTVLPIFGVLGIVSFIFAIKIPSLRPWYIVTGLIGVVAFLLFAFYIWALGAGWKN